MKEDDVILLPRPFQDVAEIMAFRNHQRIPNFRSIGWYIPP